MNNRLAQPVVFLCGSWAIVVLVYGLSAGSVYPLEGLPFLLIAGAVLSVVLGISISGLLSGKIERSGSRLFPSRGGIKYDETKLDKAYAMLCVALLGYYLIQVYAILPVIRSMGGFGAIYNGGYGQQFRRAYLSERLDATSSGLSTGGIVFSIFGYMLFLGTLALVFAGYYAAVGKYIRAAIPLVFLGIYSLLILERASFMYGACLFLVSWAYHYYSCQGVRRIRPIRAISAVLIVGAVTWMVAAIPAMLRSTGLGASDYQAGVVDYLTSGMAGVNGLAHVDPTLQAAATGSGAVYAPTSIGTAIPGKGYGVWTFQGLVGILDRIGLVDRVPSTGMGYVQTGPDMGSISNVYTFLIYFYYDGGFIGVIVGGVVLGFVAGWADRAVVVRRFPEAVVLACVLGSTLGMSFFGLAMVRDFRYIFLVVVGAFISRYLTGTKSHRAREEVGGSVSLPCSSARPVGDG
ncbi:oligosaccharide repeat unit polymerase [Gordonia sp. NPDC003376]